jgi:hypothetical protein
MTYEKFLKVILEQQLLDKQIDEAYKLKIDLTEFVDGYHKIISTLITEIYGDEGYEWYSWFCYESDYGTKGVEAWDKDENPIFYSFESTWEYLEANYKNKPVTPEIKEVKEVEYLNLTDILNELVGDNFPSYFKPKKTAVKYDSTTESFISLYDYQGHRDINGVAKQLFKYALSQDIKPQTRNIENPKYQGIVYLYPRYIIVDFFKKLNDNLPF